MKSKRKSKPLVLGIIAEDNSDVLCLKVLSRRISGIDMSALYFVGDGCGKVMRNCSAWAELLRKRGCNLLVVVHDRDRKDASVLHKELTDAMAPCPFTNHLVCIPVEELEAWLLSDESALSKLFGIKFKAISHPENVASPKEHIERMVRSKSFRQKQYINTTHNPKIAALVDLNLISHKCPSFRPFHKFISDHYC